MYVLPLSSFFHIRPASFTRSHNHSIILTLIIVIMLWSCYQYIQHFFLFHFILFIQIHYAHMQVDQKNFQLKTSSFLLLFTDLCSSLSCIQTIYFTWYSVEFGISYRQCSFVFPYFPVTIFF